MAQRITAELKRYSIPQAIFAQRVLCRSQGTLSDLLRNPKPWSKLKSGRETFRRMWKWLQEPEFQRMSALRLAGRLRSPDPAALPWLGALPRSVRVAAPLPPSLTSPGGRSPTPPAGSGRARGPGDRPAASEAAVPALSRSRARRLRIVPRSPRIVPRPGAPWRGLPAPQRSIVLRGRGSCGEAAELFVAITPPLFHFGRSRCGATNLRPFMSGG